MSGLRTSNVDEHDIAALNYLSNAEFKTRYRVLTDAPAPRLMNRALLITAVAYETIRQPHRDRLRPLRQLAQTGGDHASGR